MYQRLQWGVEGYVLTHTLDIGYDRKITVRVLCYNIIWSRYYCVE